MKQMTSPRSMFYCALLLPSCPFDKMLSAELKALVPVQQLHWVPEGDVYGILDQQGGMVACMVKDLSLPTEGLMVPGPGMLCDC